MTLARQATLENLFGHLNDIRGVTLVIKKKKKIPLKIGTLYVHL